MSWKHDSKSFPLIKLNTTRNYSGKSHEKSHKKERKNVKSYSIHIPNRSTPQQTGQRYAMEWWKMSKRKWSQRTKIIMWIYTTEDIQGYILWKINHLPFITISSSFLLFVLLSAYRFLLVLSEVMAAGGWWKEAAMVTDGGNVDGVEAMVYCYINIRTSECCVVCICWLFLFSVCSLNEICH